MALTEASREACAMALDTLLARCDGATAAMLAFRDGRPYVDRVRKAPMQGKFAAMSSSLVALGQSILREVQGGTLDHVLVEGNGGKFVVASIPGSGGLLVIAVLANHDARLGLVLGHAKTCALAVSAAIA